jgi:hypothetical protein
VDQPDDLVFPSPNGGYLDDMAVRRAFVKALAAAELPRIRFHDLRHCFATLAVGVWELPRVQAYCGHAHISTTMRYVHHSPAAEDAATLSAALSGELAPAPAPGPARPELKQAEHDQDDDADRADVEQQCAAEDHAALLPDTQEKVPNLVPNRTKSAVTQSN